MINDPQVAQRKVLRRFTAAFVGAAIAAVAYAFVVPPQIDLVAENFESLTRLNERDRWFHVPLLVIVLVGSQVAELGWIFFAERRLPGRPRLPRREPTDLFSGRALISAGIVALVIVELLPEASGLYLAGVRDNVLRVVASTDPATLVVVWMALLGAGHVSKELAVGLWRLFSGRRQREPAEHAPMP